MKIKKPQIKGKKLKKIKSAFGLLKGHNLIVDWKQLKKEEVEHEEKEFSKY